MKLYTFLNEEGEIIVQVKAEDHDEAIRESGNNNIDRNTDFYSEEY